MSYILYTKNSTFGPSILQREEQILLLYKSLRNPMHMPTPRFGGGGGVVPEWLKFNRF